MPALSLFRVVSWVLTSVTYVFDPMNSHAIQFAIGVVAALFIAALLSIYLLNRSAIERNQVARLAFVEAIALPAVLVPTGGFASPLVWYALNPLLTAAIYLPIGYTWAVLASFVTAAWAATVLSPVVDSTTLLEYRTTVLVLVLVTMTAHIQTRLLRTLEERSQRVSRTLDYLSEVYQVVENAGATQNESDLQELITLYAKQLTGAEKAAYWPAEEDDPGVLKPAPNIVRGLREGVLVEDFRALITGFWGGLTGNTAAVYCHDVEGVRWNVSCAAVQSLDKRFGAIAVIGRNPFNADIDVGRTMAFLGDLAGAMFERLRFEEVHGRLLVAEEQARIAAEIHDGVSQSLFSLVYGIQGTMANLADGNAEEARRTLQTLRDVASSISQEIRASIHQLSRADSRGTWVGAIRAYLQDVEGLYAIDTAFRATGSEDNLSQAARRAIYRIVREAASNAARHGKGSRIEVALSMGPQQALLEVADDGRGFEPPASLVQRLEPSAPGGLGLLNMHQLARSVGGSLKIDSRPGSGTKLTVRIPDRILESEGQRLETAADR